MNALLLPLLLVALPTEAPASPPLRAETTPPAAELPQAEAAPPDTVAALREASRLLYEYYASLRRLRDQAIIPCRRGEEDGACVSERIGPDTPVDWVPACRGTGVAECLAGDWDCVGPVRGDCLDSFHRAELIERLEALAPEAGASIWLYQQRVGMAVKHGDLARARQVAHECGSIHWFCPALRGFVEHRIRMGNGRAQFDSALALAPERVRCFLTDPSPLWWERPTSDCPDEMEERRRAWWLSDPLWTQRGNEREAEHFARHVMNWISWGARSSDIRELLWERVEERVARSLQEGGGLRSLSRGPFNSVDHRTTSRRLVWQYHLYGGHSFAPSAAILESPPESSARDWEVQWDEGLERMFITENWYNLDHQSVMLRRGSRLRVVAAAALPPELDAPAAASLAVGRVDDLEIFTTPAARDPEGNVRVGTLVDGGDYVGSVEVVGANGIGRAREGLRIATLPDGFGLSRPVLVKGGSSPEGAELVDILLPTTVLARDAEVALYFEVYGADPEESLTIRLSTERQSRSFWSRITSIFGGSDPPVDVTWTESVAPEDTADGSSLRRTFDLDLGSLPTGTHRLVLQVERAGGGMVEAARRIQVVE